MKGLQTISLCMLVIAALTLASCGKRSSPVNPELRSCESVSSEGHQTASVQATYTEEDWKLMRMPYTERLAYLEERFKELVYKFHGIVIEESFSAA